jgi:uncharacterized protein YllA (UPF0747 family)
MEIDIGSILGNAVLAAAVYTLLNAQLTYLKGLIAEREKRISELEDDLDKAHEAHRKDLQTWAGINRGAIGEDETRRFISEENRRRLADEYEKRKRLDDSSTSAD